jgi:hypothetical protein
MEDSGSAPSAPDREFLRKKSKALFGNRDRLEVATEVARSESAAVNAADLSYALRLPNNRVRAQLIALASVGLLEAMPHDGTTGRVWFIRRQSQFWSACVELTDAWERERARS